MLSKLFAQFIKHKVITGVIFLVIAGSSYWIYGKIFNNNDVIRYVTAQVQKGTLIVSVSGSGYVSASDQVDVKPKVSGEVTAVYAKPGQEVAMGAILVALDSRDAERTVRDTETALETAKLELDKMLEPIDELTLLQAENSLEQAKKSKQKAEDNIKKAYEDGFNSVSNAFLDLPNIMAGLENILFSNTIDPKSGSGDNITWYLNQTDYQGGARDKAIRYRDDVYTAYNKARQSYTANFDLYKAAWRNSSNEVIDTLISETYNTSQFIADAIKAADNYIDFVQDEMESRDLTIPQIVNTHQSNISLYTGKINSIIVNLLSIQRSLKDSREAIIDANNTIKERELFLEKIKKGPDDLDIRAKKISIQQKQDALITAKQTLADHYIRAPFAGIIAKVNAKKGDTVSTGAALITLITKQKIAEIYLNEVDFAKVKVGQKATLTFDAIPNLTVAGQVTEVDEVGTISQGVVTYTVKIGFSVEDNRVKPGMSVSATIITEVKPDVFLIPNSAVKSQGGMSYVEIVEGDDRNTALTANTRGTILKNPPRRQNVEIGTVGDEFTEVKDGLNEGDVVVIRILQSTKQILQNQQNSSMRIPGFNSGRTGNFPTR